MAPVSTQVVDFSGVKDGGGSFNKKRVPSGDYLATVVKVEDAAAKSDGEFQYLFTIQLKQYSQYKYPYYCKLVENQLWKLRNILIAAGLTVPKKKQKLNPSKIVGRQIGVTMEDDEFDGKLQSNVQSVFPASELSEGTLVTDDDEAEEGEYEESGMDEFAPDEEADEGDEFDAMSRDELKQFIRGQDSEARFKKSESDDDLRDRARDVAPGDEEAEEEPEEEEEEEEEEPPPPPKKRTARKRTAKKKTPPPADDDDELEELDIDDEL